MRRLIALLMLLTAACVSFSDPKGDDDDDGNLRPVAAVVVPTDVLPFGTAFLDASGSQDPDAVSGSGIVDFEWELTDVPAGSTANITGDEFAQFFVDAGGTFSGTLRVSDIDGEFSDPLGFEVVTATTLDWEFELSWEEPVDMDLHVIAVSLATNAHGLFGDGDCGYQNLMVDWPPLGELDGNCRHLGDDMDGGTELVIVTNGSFSYRAVAYWHSNNASVPNTTASISIHRNGTLVYQGSRTLVLDNQAWNAAVVTSDGSAAAVDTLFTYP